MENKDTNTDYQEVNGSTPSPTICDIYKISEILLCTVAKTYSKMSISPQFWFEGPTLGVLKPSWAPEVVWN